MAEEDTILEYPALAAYTGKVWRILVKKKELIAVIVPSIDYLNLNVPYYKKEKWLTEESVVEFRDLYLSPHSEKIKSLSNEYWKIAIDMTDPSCETQIVNMVRRLVGHKTCNRKEVEEGRTCKLEDLQDTLNCVSKRFNWLTVENLDWMTSKVSSKFLRQILSPNDIVLPWSPKSHKYCSDEMKAIVHIMLLLHKKQSSVIYNIPRDMLFLIVEFVSLE
jgi:hypothetical protein